MSSPSSTCASMMTHCCILIFTGTFDCFKQGEEGPPSLEYIKAKDLFPQKELVKEDEGLQVSRAADPLVSPGLEVGVFSVPSQLGG